MKLKQPTADPLARLEATHILVHYDEIGLKGKNRGRFENQLVKNLKKALKTTGATTVSRLFGRIAVRLEKSQPWQAIAPAISKVFGVAYLLPAVTCSCTMKTLLSTARELVERVEGEHSFAVKCKRSSKSLPYTSMDVQREIGTAVQNIKSWPVDLEHPDVLIRVELVNDAAYIAIHRVEGPGGLPSGVSGRVVCLQSGGIDSPVAAYQMMQRGAVPIYVHFHSYPHTTLASQSKVKELITAIHPTGIPSRLYMIPFAELQRRIVTECPAGLRVILYRRFMVRAAEAVAEKENALALVTGESLGQVASQTLENLYTIDSVSRLPVLRPLIGRDKLEIINKARQIGTYEISIEPHDDCCSYLMPANPATHSSPEELEKSEEAFDVDAEVRALLEGAEVLGNDEWNET